MISQRKIRIRGKAPSFFPFGHAAFPRNTLEGNSSWLREAAGSAPVQVSGSEKKRNSSTPASSPGIAPSRPHLTGAILAGGMSRRLGQDKASLKLGGKPLALWVADIIAPLVTDLWLVTNQPLAHLAFGLPVLSDLTPDQGPLGGLRTALFYSRTPWVLAVSVDNPFLIPDLLKTLADRAATTRRAAVVCRTARGLEPFPGLYAVRLRDRLSEYLTTKIHVRPFLERIRPETLEADELSPQESPEKNFFNLNTPEDLIRAENWLATGKMSSQEPK